MMEGNPNFKCDRSKLEWGNSSYVHVAPHHDVSNRVLMCNRQGKIWLAMVPEVNGGSTFTKYKY